MQFQGKRLRHELKYYIHPHEQIGLRNRLRPILKLDRHSSSNEGYHIRSLYFDNANESALYDKNNGVFRRRKYRIRIYNISDRVIKLERKSKWNEYVAKESAALSREQVEFLLSGDYDCLRKETVPLLAEFYGDLKQGVMKPTVIVDYIREAYIDEPSDVRITFDKQLAAGISSYDLFDKDLMTWGAIEGTRTILEVKFNQYMPEPIRSIVQMSAFQRSTISKYVLCRERQKVYGD